MSQQNSMLSKSELEEIIKKDGGDFFIMPKEGDAKKEMKRLNEFKAKHEGEKLAHFIRENGEGVVVVDNGKLGIDESDMMKKDSMDKYSAEELKELENIKWASYHNQNKGKDRTATKKNTPQRRLKMKLKSKAQKKARRNQRGR